MSITKNTPTDKPTMLLAHGSRDTKVHDSAAMYDGITLVEIGRLVETPTALDKTSASFVICSSYREHDGRNHEAQRLNGEYHMMAIDVDEGNPSLDELFEAVQDVTGNASALYYSSSSATEANKKWRVLIPLAEPLPGVDYADYQLALFEQLRIKHSITCDEVLSRTGQPIYLPNVPADKRVDGEPLFYQSRKERGQGFLKPKTGQINATVVFRRKNEEMAAKRAAADRERRAADRLEKREQYPDNVDPVDEFNARHTVEDMLLANGYERQGASDSYKSPMQSSGSHATKCFGDYWVSMSGSDVASGVGTGKENYCWGDAFDLYVYFDHSGDFTSAVRTYGQELKPSPFEEVNKQISDAPISEDLDDFEYIPDEQHTLPEVKSDMIDDDDKPLEWPTPVSRIDEATLPRRRWVYGSTYIRGFLTVTASAGGIGKTSLAMVEALAIVTGRPLLGEKVHEPTSVWLVNLEDDLTEMQIRLAAAMKHYGIAHEEIAGKLFMDGEDTISIMLAAEGREGIVQNDALLNFMRDKVNDNAIGTVIIDPFISTHAVNENSNSSIQVVVAMLRKLARETSAAVHLVHHVRKSNGEAATVDSVRGAGSLIGAARSARVVNKLTDEELNKLGLEPDDVIGLFRVDNGKANLAPPAENGVYRRMVSVTLANGESVGVCCEYKLPDKWEGMTTPIVNSMLSLINAGPESGEMFSSRPQDKARFAGTVVTNFNFPKAADNKSAVQARGIIKEWMDTGLLEEITYHSPSQRKERKGVQSSGRVGEQ